jgi:hypothetical protein
MRVKYRDCTGNARIQFEFRRRAKMECKSGSEPMQYMSRKRKAEQEANERRSKQAKPECPSLKSLIDMKLAELVEQNPQVLDDIASNTPSDVLVSTVVHIYKKARNKMQMQQKAVKAAITSINDIQESIEFVNVTEGGEEEILCRWVSNLDDIASQLQKSAN